MPRRLVCALSAVLLSSAMFATASPSMAQDTQALQGGVVKVETCLNDLRDARLSVHRVRKPVASLVTWQEINMDYDNAIADTSKALDKNLKELDHTLKIGISILQKAAKESEKKHATMSEAILVAQKPAEKPILNDAERARLKRQMEDLQNTKLKQAEAATKNIKDGALREGKTIDATAQQAKDKVDRAVNNYSWYYGKDAASAVGAAKKLQIEQQANAEKQKIADEAKRRAAVQAAAAKKSVENITDSVKGLKSQVAKPGQYGLQPQGSNLHIRNYGTSK